MWMCKHRTYHVVLLLVFTWVEARTEDKARRVTWSEAMFWDAEEAIGSIKANELAASAAPCGTATQLCLWPDAIFSALASTSTSTVSSMYCQQCECICNRKTADFIWKYNELKVSEIVNNYDIIMNYITMNSLKFCSSSCLGKLENKLI